MIANPRVGGLGTDARMPGYEVRESFDLVRRFDDAHMRRRRSNFPSARGTVRPDRRERRSSMLERRREFGARLSALAKSFPGYGPYIASKAAVEGLVRVLANELRGREITVNAERKTTGSDDAEQSHDPRPAGPGTYRAAGRPHNVASIVCRQDHRRASPRPQKFNAS